MVDLGNILTGSGMIAIFGLLYKLNVDVRKDTDRKVNRNYERIDEVKKQNDKDYTRRDVCEVRHEQITKDFTEVKQDLKEIKTDIRTLIKNGSH